MIFEKFSEKHVKEALEIAKLNYDEERRAVIELPVDIKYPNFDYFVNNELGIAAVENGKLVGYICVYKPWEGGFDTFDSLSTFSPLFLNGAIKENKTRIYQDMIEYALDKWEKLGIVAFGICVLAHDIDAKNALFEYGFGMRLKDRIKTIEKNDCKTELSFKELSVNEFPLIRQMRIDLDNHLKNSPCFLQSTSDECLEWLKTVEEGDRRTFVMEKDSSIIGYIDITDEGENIITRHKLMANINGAYCKKEYRGKGYMNELLQFVENVLYDEGYRMLGVDHESYNPTANRFWDKHFKEYTNSVVRKIENWSKIK